MYHNHQTPAPLRGLTATFALVAAVFASSAQAVTPDIFAPAAGAPAPSEPAPPAPDLGKPTPASTKPSALATAPKAPGASGLVEESVSATRLGKVNGQWIFRGTDKTYLFESAKSLQVVRKPVFPNNTISAPDVPAYEGPALAPKESRPNLPSAVGTAGPGVSKPLPPPTAGSSPTVSKAKETSSK